MSSVVQRIKKEGLVKNMPYWLPANMAYEIITGSVAYGVSSDTSDMDISGFCIPPKDVVFPHLSGEIFGFGKQNKRFEQYIQHHIKDPSARKEYDVTIFNIVKYFQLCMDNNPNMIDTLFTPVNCIVHITSVGNIVRENRKVFLHKGAWHKFKGYAYSQLHKAEIKTPEEGSKRKANIEKYGFDTKFMYHVIRLMGEVEQILEEGDLDIQRNKEHLKAIRAGEVSFEEIKNWFSIKEKELEKLYNNSKLPHSPDENKIKTILINCLEEHYGDLSSAIIKPDIASQAIKEIKEVIERNRL